jgi:hypothetical protein
MPNRLALAGAVFIAIAELLGPQRASAPEAQSGRRYKNGDAAAQRFGSQRGCGESGLTLMAVALFHGSMLRSRAAATSAPAKFGIRPCGGNGKRATPSALLAAEGIR